MNVRVSYSLPERLVRKIVAERIARIKVGYSRREAGYSRIVADAVEAYTKPIIGARAAPRERRCTGCNRTGHNWLTCWRNPKRRKR